MRFLIHVVSATDAPTRTALGLLIAKSAAEEGHQVDVFLAGDGAGLAKPETAARIDGLGTGNAGEWLASLRELEVPVYVSAMSAQARGIQRETLEADGFIPSPPTKLVALAAAADRVLVY